MLIREGVLMPELPFFSADLMPEKMILFWSVIATLTLGALVFLLPPLLRSTRAQGIQSDALDIALYREQQEEINAALGESRMTWEQAAQARRELDARLVAEAGGAAEEEGQQRWRDRGTPILAGAVGCLTLVLISAGLYLNYGGWQSLEMRYSSGDMLVGQLAHRMQSRPDDMQGWMLLAGAYRKQGKMQEAADAYARVNARQPAAETLVAEAEMRALANEREWAGRPESLIQSALEINPSHGPALWYAGMIAAGRQEWLVALRHWETLAREDLPEAFRDVVDRQIAQAAEVYSQQPGAVLLPVRVTIDEAVSGRLPSEAVLFVSARTEAGGPPLAVVRRPLKEFPVTVLLHDGQAMLPHHVLSGADQWQVTARVSGSGTAMPAPGDLKGVRAVDRGQLHGETSGPVEVMIDTLVSQ